MAKEKQPMVDVELGIQQTSLTDNKPERSESETLWSSKRCIYRVPNPLRKVKSEAYKPQMLLIGPLQHYKKAKDPIKYKEDQKKRYFEYNNMEDRKKKYLAVFEEKYEKQTIQEFRRIIEMCEEKIRSSYDEFRERIQSEKFVEMILLDSVFILEFFIQAETQEITKKGALLSEEPPSLVTTIKEDLILIENQLPYKLLEILFQSFSSKHQIEEPFANIIIRVFGLEGKIQGEVEFLHFTDLFRSVRVATLALTDGKQQKKINSLENAEKLASEGVDFAPVDKENDISLVIVLQSRFLKMPCFGRVLKMPCLTADDANEKLLRNLLAFEHHHWPYNAYLSNYIFFLNNLISSNKDVDLLVEKGVVKNNLGNQASVVKMVKDMCKGLEDSESYYYHVAESLNDLKTNYVKLHFNKSIATLKRVYFKDVWTGTATVTAIVLLVLALLQTIASFIQVKQNANKPAPPPAPIRKP